MEKTPSKTSIYEDMKFGDVMFMNRKCLAMKDPLGVFLCSFTKTENRFDHVGLILKLSESDFAKFPRANEIAKDRSPSNTYILETNIRGVTLYSAEKRIEQSSAHEFARRSLINEKGDDTAFRHTMLRELETMYQTPYRIEIEGVIPSVLSPPDKMDRMDAARKLVELEHQQNNIMNLLSNASGAEKDFLLVLKESFSNAQRFIAQTYFSHLKGYEKGVSCMEWQDGHFYVDGVNQSPRMVCSEFISNLWLRCGWTLGFVPSSSNRPFDLLDDERFNFVLPELHFGELQLIKGTDPVVKRYWSEVPTDSNGSPPLETDPVQFLNRIRAQFGMVPVSGLSDLSRHLPILPDGYVIQSSTWRNTLQDAWIRTAGTGVLFSVVSFACSPLTMLRMEQQLGVFLVRGSLWSLGCGVLARNLLFVAAQSFFLMAYGHFTSKRKGSGAVMGPKVEGNGVVEWRHPYYELVKGVWASCMVGHVVSTPVYSWVVHRHFCPVKPGPVPLRLLMKGSLVLSPFCLLLPFQACWVYWYETLGSMIIPTRSSIFRPREDLLEKSYWPHYRNDALFGAFFATLAVDCCRYPLATRVMRGFVRESYYPSSVPTFGRRKFFPGYRYQLLTNVCIFGLTVGVVSLYGLI